MIPNHARFQLRYIPMSSGEGIRTLNLQVMSLASFQLLSPRELQRQDLNLRYKPYEGWLEPLQSTLQ